MHRGLLGSGTVSIRPAGLTGMGGIGKTQLAVDMPTVTATSIPAA